jgi:hypothetical protein
VPGDRYDQLVTLLPAFARRMQLRSVADAETNADRRHAATILEHLCLYYTKDDEYLKELKKAVTNVMPEVINLCRH